MENLSQITQALRRENKSEAQFCVIWRVKRYSSRSDFYKGNSDEELLKISRMFGTCWMDMMYSKQLEQEPRTRNDKKSEHTSTQIS